MSSLLEKKENIFLTIVTKIITFMNSKFLLLRIPYYNVTSLQIYLQNLKRVCHNQYIQPFLYWLKLIYIDK